MRVMHIALGGCLRPPPVNYGLTEDTGGHIAYVLGAAMAQARRPGIDAVEIVTRAFDDARLGACHAREREKVSEGCTILRLRTQRTGYLSKSGLAAELPALERAFVVRLEAGPRPDVIHAHFSDAAELARAAWRRFGIPWVYSSHSLALDKGGADPDRIDRETAAIAEAGAIVASSRDEAERQVTAYLPAAEGRTHRVNPGVTLPPGDETGPAERLIAPFLRAPDRPAIVAIARPIPKKNLAALLEAYGAAPDLRGSANLVILAGQRDGLFATEDETVTARLFDLVDRHDLWGHVALPRRHSAAEVASLYALAARRGVFVNPARHEPFGLTLIEAARAGVPLVATRNGGPADILRSIGAGELVDPDDPADIAAAIRRVLSDPDRASRAAAAQSRARALYDWDRWAGRVAGIYRTLRGPAAAPRDMAARPGRRLLACDLDGTLTGSRAAARRFALWRAGPGRHHVLAVATGRPVAEARRVIEDWGLPMPDLFITSVGTEIWRWTGRGALVPCAAFASHIAAGWSAAGIDAALAPLGLVPQARCEQRRWKRSWLGGPSDAARIRAALAASGLAARAVASHGRLIDVLPSRSGKAAAVAFEAARRGLPEEACIVAGDSGNDADMLVRFGSAIMPAGASAEIAGLRGPYRSPRRHADGVLDGLARFAPPPLMAADMAAE